MQLIRTEFQHKTLPMLMDANSMMYTVTKVVALALAVTEDDLVHFRIKHQNRLQNVRLPDLHAKEFFQVNREEFGIKRVRNDMILWSIADIMFATSRINTPEADVYRKEFSRVIIENVRKSLITYEQWEQMLQGMKREAQEREEKMAQKMEALQRDIDAARISAQSFATAAGVALAAQRGTRHLRVVR